MQARKLVAELLGTAILVFFAVGVATLSFGFKPGGAFAAEVILTFLFAMIVLAATSHRTSAGFAGLAIGMGLAIVHLVGIPLTGTSVNPARSLGPALIVGGDALSQLWLFIVAPLVGGAIAALVWGFLFVTPSSEEPEPAGRVEPSDIEPSTDS
jgi:aquaporin Z